MTQSFPLRNRSLKVNGLFGLTWDFSTEAVCLSHIGLISMPRSLSLSPWWKNSSIMRSVHWRYRSKDLVGLLRSAQWTILRKTCGHCETGHWRLFRHKYWRHKWVSDLGLPVSCLYSCQAAILPSWSPSSSQPLSSDQQVSSCAWTCLLLVPINTDETLV